MAKLNRRELSLRVCYSCDKRTAHFGRFCLRCPDWSIWPERIATVYVDEKADSRDVLKRLSDSWRIDYKVANSSRPHSRVTQIDAMLLVLYAEPIQAQKQSLGWLDSFPRKAAGA